MGPELKKKPEPSFAVELLELLRKGFEQKGVPFSPFCGSKEGFIKRIVSVRSDGTAAGPGGIKFADGVLYVRSDVYERAQKDPSKFAVEAAEAVKAGLRSKSKWDRTFKTLEADLATLDGISAKLKSGPYNLAAMPDREKQERMVELDGGVSVPKSIHDLYFSLTYAKKGIFLTDQALSVGYSEYKRGVDSKQIKPGLFIIADFNLNSAHRRFYLMDFSDPNHPAVLDSLTVAHGLNSDPNRDGWIDTMSNEMDSHKSSRGLYVIVQGEWKPKFEGIAWTLEGRNETSSRALQRGVLIHRKLNNIKSYTWGCFGLDPSDAQQIGLPLAGNMASKSKADQKKMVDGWVGVGIYVYYSPPVQDFYKKHWKVK